MSSTADRTADPALPEGAPEPLSRAEGLELLGDVDGSGYAKGASLVRRADGQMVQLGPLTYALLEVVDGERDRSELSAAMCERLGRDCDEEHVAAIARKLGEQGLLAGSEANAPQRSNPLLALRWKLVVTDPERTRRLTAPFLWLFRPAVIALVLVAFVAACWFVLFDHGLASGVAQMFERPELILLLVALGIAAAGFHELGHAAACRYGGGTPGAMGAGIYLVWPAFYTDVTDAYRLPRGARLRTDLGGLYFNAIVVVATLAAWFAYRVDALLVLISLQLIGMVRQLSPVIRADGYHILADATGVPDLYAHIVPTLRQLVPGRRRSPSALTGRARVIVSAWVLVIVPILLSVALGAVLLLPKLVASTWASGSNVASQLSAQVGDGQVLEALVSVLRLGALTLPVLGSLLIIKHLLQGAVVRAAAWSRGHAGRRAFVALLAAGVAGLVAGAWWPAGQYEPIRASDRGTLDQAGQLVSSRSAAVPEPTAAAAAQPPTVPPGTHVAVSLIPEGGATETDPAIFIITDPGGGGTPVIITSTSTPSEAAPSTGTSADPAIEPDSGEATPDDPDVATEEPPSTTATAFSFDLPDAPEEGDSQALAVNREDGGAMYEVAYSLVTVRDGDPVDQRNGAHAYANCTACTTVAVSFQVILVVGSSPLITPVNLAEALNGNCPACVTTAIANQIVVSLTEEPSDELLAELNAELERLDEIGELGPEATPNDVATQVGAVQQQINQLLADSGLLPEDDEAAADAETSTIVPEGEAVPEQPTETTSEDPATDTDTEDATTEPPTEPAPAPAPTDGTAEPAPAESTAPAAA